MASETDRDRFLARVRASLAGSQASEIEEVSRGEQRGDLPETEAQRERFRREAEASGATVSSVSSIAKLRERLIALLADHAAKHVVRANTPLLAELALDAPLRDRGVAVAVCDLREPEAERERIRAVAASADVGIVAADGVVAETGTLFLVHRPGQGRAISLLPPINIAILPTRDLTADLGSLFAERAWRAGPSAEAGLPSALTFITGPSRTADIEMVLTKGVHGPRILEIVLLDDSS